MIIDIQDPNYDPKAEVDDYFDFLENEEGYGKNAWGSKATMVGWMSRRYKMNVFNHVTELSEEVEKVFSIWLSCKLITKLPGTPNCFVRR